MSQPLSHERKLCPNCGHSSRVSVKVCPQCGYAFLSSTGGILRKRCAACGHMNRLGAKACSQCGKAFESSVPSLQSDTQKWCPTCGKQRNLGAKICSNCGYRFKAPAVEKPVVQSETLAEPIKVRKTTSAPPTPKPPDLSGEPAPYISPEELKRLRDMGTQDSGLFVRLYHVLRDNKR